MIKDYFDREINLYALLAVLALFMSISIDSFRFLRDLFFANCFVDWTGNGTFYWFFLLIPLISLALHIACFKSSFFNIYKKGLNIIICAALSFALNFIHDIFLTDFIHAILTSLTSLMISLIYAYIGFKFLKSNC